jgi:hypothetical protein
MNVVMILRSIELSSIFWQELLSGATIICM